MVGVHPGFCQLDEILVSGSFNNVRFRDFINEMESNNPVRFYYEPEWIDSLSVNDTFKDEKLEYVLEEILQNTTLQINIYEKSIFITNRFKINTSLFEGPYNGRDDEDGVAKIGQSSGIDQSYVSSQERTALGDENEIIELGKHNLDPNSNFAIFSGYIRDESSGESIPGVTVYEDGLKTGTSTNSFGFYSLKLPVGRHEIIIQSVGMKKETVTIFLYGNDNLDFELREDIIPLKEIVVESEKSENITRIGTGIDLMDIKTIKELPTNIGEVDVMKIALSLPGVQNTGEAATGFNVRGGTADQNLVLFNNSIIYNSSHLFGFFSIFNPDIVKNTKLYKGSIPANYGGRISSVFNVSGRNGNTKKFSGSGGISPVSARLTFEGPIIKDKTSFLLGLRSTYSNWLLNQIPNDLFKKSEASFYDISAGLTHVFNKNNSLNLNFYTSHDDFKLNADTVYAYTNRAASVEWKHLFSPQFVGIFSANLSKYNYTINSESEPTQAFELGYDINQYNLKTDFSYFRDSNHEINFGIDANYYDLNPGFFEPTLQESLVQQKKIEEEQAFDYAFYFSDEFKMGPRMSIYAGLRYLIYHYLGPQESYVYADGFPKNETTIIDTVYYDNNEIIKTYHGPEFRLSFNYLIDLEKSIKLSFTQTRQAIHMLTNSISISPTDIWKLSDEYIPASSAWQISSGYYQNLFNNSIEASVEAYFKKTRNVLDYKSGAELIMNKHIETDIINATGMAYGLEFYIRKKLGKFNGWISYTYSRSLLKTESSFSEENISEGDYYPNYIDQPHNLSIIGNFKFTRRFSISSSLFYNTGRPLSIPEAKYPFAGKTRFYYSNRNTYRIPDYFRIDLSLKLEGNHKIKKLAHSSWVFSIYNLTGRDNVYSIYFVSSEQKVQGYKISIFSNPVPTITYNFKF
jgi:hypothetical protein